MSTISEPGTAAHNTATSRKAGSEHENQRVKEYSGGITALST
jgi:hypothetical protein